MVKAPREKPVFHFFGTVEGALGQITVSAPVQRDKHAWTARLEMTGPSRVDVVVHGATKKQAADLALGLCHAHVGSRELVDRSGAAIRVPGKPLPKPDDVDGGLRAEQAVCICLVDEGQGTTRLVLDDVSRDGASWTTQAFYTHRRYPTKALLGLSLTEKELADIGLVVLLRLGAGARNVTPTVSSPASLARMATKKTKGGLAPVGTIASINASLMLVLLDGALVPSWEALDPDTDGDDIGGHPQKVVDFLDDDEDFVSGPLKVGKGKALVLSLEAQTGEAEVYRLPSGTLALVEPPRAWWDDADNYGKKRDEVAAMFDEALAGPGKAARKAGKVDVPSGKLVTFDSNVDVAPASKVLKKALKTGDVKPFGDDEGGLVMAVAPGSYQVRRQVFERKWAEDQPLVVAYLEPA